MCHRDRVYRSAAYFGAATQCKHLNLRSAWTLRRPFCAPPNPKSPNPLSFAKTISRHKNPSRCLKASMNPLRRRDSSLLSACARALRRTVYFPSARCGPCWRAHPTSWFSIRNTAEKQRRTRRNEEEKKRKMHVEDEMWLVIYAAVVRDLASVETLAMCERLVSQRYSSGSLSWVRSCWPRP